jgi:hypothetical protein
MYAFRKPFTAATFEAVLLEGTTFKTMLVTSQVSGYMLSKLIGIKVISEMPPRLRARSILGLIAAAELALVLFGLVRPPWNAVCLFFNGLPLGMVFGLVLGFLEGRRVTEALTAGLCASFVLADGVTRSLGAALLSWGVSEYWMPSAAGGLFLAPLLVFVWMLSRVPAPDLDDCAARTERDVMTAGDRRALVWAYLPGLSLLLVVYLAVTILRSLRADFAPELWKALGAAVQPETFAQSELWVALGVLTLNGAAVLIRDNRRAFFTSLATCGLGFVLLALALVGRAGPLEGRPFPFMVLVGLGLYLPYVAVHTTVFERLIAMTRERGNLGFLMYLADTVGYLGYVVIMLNRGSLPGGDQLLTFFISACWLTCLLSALCLWGSWRYFAGRPEAQLATQAVEMGA